MAVSKSVIVFHTLLPEFEYFRPKTLQEALELLDKYQGDAKVMAGGTGLLFFMRLRWMQAKYVIDIKGIKELHTIKYEEGKGLTVGATVTLSELFENEIVKNKYPILWDGIRQLADMHIRNRATLVGNLCFGMPSADTAPALLTLKAKLNVVSVNGTRTIELKDFFKGEGKTALKPNEMVTSVFIPEPPEGAKGRYLKFVRTADDGPIMGIAVLVANPRDPAKRIVRIAFSNVVSTPIIIDEVEELFKQDKPLGELAEEAIKLIKSKVTPKSDVRGSRELREHLMEYGTRYLLKTLIEG